jgi:hypothetical protein
MAKSPSKLENKTLPSLCLPTWLQQNLRISTNHKYRIYTWMFFATGRFEDLTFCKPDVSDVLKPDVFKPDVLKPDVLWVYLVLRVPDVYPFVGIGFPPTSQRVCLFPWTRMGRSNTPLRVRDWGVSNSDDWIESGHSVLESCCSLTVNFATTA